MDIYWIEDKQKKGPAAVPDVIARIQMGEITPDTLGWHTGCEKWVPLRELPALADFIVCLDKDKPDSAQTNQEPPNTTENTPQPPPLPMSEVPQPAGIGRRLLARLTDYALYAAIFMGIIYLLKVPYNELLLFSQPLFWIPCIILEALILSKFGITPGKKLMGIRVTSLLDGKHPGGMASFSRSLGVFIMGMGCFIPLLSIVMMLIAARMCSKHRLTLWDTRARTVVLTTPGSHPAIFLCIVLIFVSMQLVSYFTAPWIPEILQQIAEQSPEFAEWLKQSMAHPQ